MNNILPQDEAMDSFRQLFPGLSRRVVVTDDGTRMTYDVHSERIGLEWVKMAQRIIRENGLPLSARFKVWCAKGVIFGQWLVIEFMPKMQELPCY